MNNKFRRVAAFAMAMTVIAGSSNVFNVGVGGLPNLTSIVANAEDNYKVHNLINGQSIVNYSDLSNGDIIIVADDINYVAGIFNNTGDTVYINQFTLHDGNAFALERGYKYKVTSREGGIDVTEIKFNYIDASFSGGDTEETILREQSIIADAGVVILNKNNIVTDWVGGKTYVVMDNVTFDSRITVNSTVNLILCDGATLTANKGITVGQNTTLNIYAQSTGEGVDVGNLVAFGSFEQNESGDQSYYFAPIGEIVSVNDVGNSAHGNAGTINIYGGNVNAKVGEAEYVPAIGGMNGTVNIYDGYVNANAMHGNMISTDYSRCGIFGSNINIYSGFARARGFYGINGTTTNIYGGLVEASGFRENNGINGGLTVGNGVKVYGSFDPIGEGNTGKQIFDNGAGYERYPYMKTIGNQPEMEIKAPTITIQPSDIEVKKDSTSDNTLTVAANADTGCTFSYQWYSSTDNSVGTNEDNILINGATNSTYTVPTGNVGKKYYYCEVTAKKGSQAKTTVSDVAEVGVYASQIKFNPNRPTSAANSVSGETAAINIYKDGSYILTENAFTLGGYTFAGWNTAPDGSGTPFDDKGTINLSSDSNNDVVLYAQWNAITALAPTLNNDDIPAELEYKYGVTPLEGISVAVSNPDTDTYNYSYQWYSNTTDSNEGGTEINGATNPSYTIPTNGVGEKYYYCKVTATRKDNGETDTAYSNRSKVNVYYEVLFDKGAADATGNIPAIKSYDGNVVLPAAGFTRNGYDLAGWKIGDNGSRINANTTTAISDNAIFTAQWYKPVLGINNSNIDDNNTIPVVVGYNKTETLSANVINDASYDYSYKWYEDDVVIQGATSPNYTIPTGKEVGEHKYYCEVTAKHKTSNNTITANSVTITFKVNSIPVQDNEITAGLVFEGKQTPEAVDVMYGSTSLSSTNDYDVEEVKDGEGNLCAVKITLKGNYSGSKTISFDYTPEKLATHSTNGNVAYWTYNDVNYIKENGKFKEADDLTIPSTSINSNIRVQTSRIEPTSEKDGYIITKIYCADCGKLISYKRVRIPKLS